jgi:hypothetical protein
VQAALWMLAGALAIHGQNVLKACCEAGTTRLSDLHELLAATTLMLGGGDIYKPLGIAPAEVFSTDYQHAGYPPTTILLLAPWTMLGNPWRDFAWILLTEVLVVAIVVMVYAGIGRPSVAEAALAGALGLVFFPLLNGIYYGQVQLLILFLVVGTVLAAQRGHPAIAGVLLALAIGFRLTPAVIVLYFAWSRNWRALAWTIAAVALLVGITLAVGWGPRWVGYFALAGPLGRGTAFAGNQSINGFMLRAWRPELSGLPIEPLPVWFRAAWYGAEILVAGAVAWGASRLRLPAGLRNWTVITIILLAVPLVEPYGWYHHYTAGLVAIIVGVRLARDGMLRGWAVMGLGAIYLLVTPVSYFPLTMALATGTVMLGQHPVLLYASSVVVYAAMAAVLLLSTARSR